MCSYYPNIFLNFIPAQQTIISNEYSYFIIISMFFFQCETNSKGIFIWSSLVYNLHVCIHVYREETSPIT